MQLAVAHNLIAKILEKFSTKCLKIKRETLSRSHPLSKHIIETLSFDQTINENKGFVHQHLRLRQ